MLQFVNLELIVGKLICMLNNFHNSYVFHGILGNFSVGTFATFCLLSSQHHLQHNVLEKTIVVTKNNTKWVKSLKF